jgi:hypothetical protein
MIGKHYIHDYYGYDPEELTEITEQYIENKFNDAGLADVITWDLCDVGARGGVQLRAFIGKSSTMWVGSPEYTIKYDMQNLYDVMDEFVEYYIENSKGFTKDSNPTRYQEESFKKYGCE